MKGFVYVSAAAVTVVFLSLAGALLVWMTNRVGDGLSATDTILTIGAGVAGLLLAVGAAGGVVTLARRVAREQQQ